MQIKNRFHFSIENSASDHTLVDLELAQWTEEKVSARFQHFQNDLLAGNRNFIIKKSGFDSS